MKPKKAVSRASLIAVAALVEVFSIMILLNNFVDKAGWLEMIMRTISVLIILSIVKNSRHLSSDMMWILLVAIFPIPGTLLFMFLGADLFSSKEFREIRKESVRAETFATQDEAVIEEAKAAYPGIAGQFNYLWYEKYPICRNQGYRYFGSGEEGFPEMLAEMKKAEKYIFLEYFIIEKGEMWDTMLEILKEKAAKGLEVRVMYDDMGSINTMPVKYTKELEAMGIRAVSFNRLSPIVNIIMNHRDHRKIMVIDGRIAFSGGINLADEYINKKVKYGYWKDTVVEVRGQAVDAMLRLFLTNWNALRHEDEDYAVFYGPHDEPIGQGFVCAYGESPLSPERVAQNVYLNIINEAQHYVYIMTPYLIIDSDMTNALILAARRGVDVKIVTPGIPDKKIVYGVTRSYYNALVAGGVHVLEYTPGFDHAKVMVADDLVCTVGTINFDYRSLYLHFENGTYLCGGDEVLHVRDDVLRAIAASREVPLSETKMFGLKEFGWSVIRLFAPLM
ncbi:MAG: cardiolipin synthase [Lachnospiraceae bacterium]|nr:cardiolipin synthase [Lachnospiraceae bacterium]